MIVYIINTHTISSNLISKKLNCYTLYFFLDICKIFVNLRDDLFTFFLFSKFIFSYKIFIYFFTL